MLRLLIVLAIFSSSCAYQIGSRQRSIPGGYSRVAVPTFSNMTYETGIETYFTKAMIAEISQDFFAQVTSRDQAQVILEGKILSISYAAGAQLSSVVTDLTVPLPSGTVLNKEYRILANVGIRLIRRSDQKVLWEGQVAGEQRYPAPQVTIAGLNSVNPLYNQSARIQNIEMMAKDMMAEAHSRLTENF